MPDPSYFSYSSTSIYSRKNDVLQAGIDGFANERLECVQGVLGALAAFHSGRQPSTRVGVRAIKSHDF